MDMSQRVGQRLKASVAGEVYSVSYSSVVTA